MFSKSITSFGIALFTCLFLLFITLSGCAGKNIAVDLASYVNQGVLDIAQLETAAMNKYASVTGVNYRSDSDLYETLKNDVIPVYNKFLGLLKNIPAQTAEIELLHSIYIQGAETMYKGFVSIKQALELRDESMMNYANGQIEKGRAESGRWRGKLLELCKEHGVKVGN